MNEELKKRLLELDAKVAQKIGVGSSSAPVAKATPTTAPSPSQDLAELRTRLGEKTVSTPAVPEYSSYSEKLVKEEGGGFVKGVAEEAKQSLNRLATSGNPFQGVVELGKLGKVLAQGFGSFAAGTTQELAEQATKIALPKQYEEGAVQKVRDTFEKIVPGFVTGGAPIESYSEWGERQQKQIDEDPSSTPWEKAHLAPILVAGMVLSDWFPGGRAAKTGASSIFRDVSTLKNKTPEVVSTILTKNNVPKELVEELTPKIINAKSVEEVDSIIKGRVTEQFNKVNEQAGLVEGVAKREEGLVSPKTYDDYVAMSKDRPEVMSKADKDMLETLTEVRKYPTLREYEDTFDVGYHGGEKIDAIDLDKSNYAKTFFISDKPEYASEYAGKYKDKGTTNKVFVSKDAKLLDIKNAPQDVINEIKRRAGGTVTGKTITIQRPDGTYFELPEVKDKPESGFGNVDIMDAIEGAIRGKAHFAEAPGLVQIYKDMGYDGMVTYEDAAMRGKNIGIWNKEKLQTESQIKDTWNKAHDKTPELKQPEQPLDFQFGEPSTRPTIDQTIEQVQKEYTGKRERRWEPTSIKNAAKSLGRYFELPAIVFEKLGLKKTIYDPIRDAQGKAQQDTMRILDKLVEKGVYKHGGVFGLGGFTISKKEAEDMSKYILNRQGKGYPAYTFDKLTPRTQKTVKAFDEVIAEMEPQFRKTAEEIGIDVGKVPNYAPLMTKEDINVIDDGIQPQWLLPHEPFFSTKGRVEDVPLDMYEPDYRLVMQRWIKGITDFNNVAPETKRVSDLIETKAIKETLSDKDMQTVQKYISDITTPDVPKSDAGKLAVKINRWSRRAQALAALGYNVKTILKQPLSLVAATVIHKAPPKLKSEYAKAFGVNVKDLPSVSIRGGDINAFNDIKSGALMQLPFQPLKKVDQKTAEKILNGLLDKEWKAVGKKGALSPDMMAHIEREAQNKLDQLMGGYFAGQRPPAYTNEISNTLLMFTYPLTSQLNTFFYHIYKGKTTPEKAKRIAEVMTTVALIAYFEQVITNLSFQWDSEEDMLKDILISASGNIPVLGNMVFAAANPGIDYQPVPIVGNIAKIKESAEQGKFEKTAWEVAHLFGVPKSLRRGIEGAQVIEEGGYKGFEVKTLPEQIRTAVGGQYGSLAGKEYLDQMNEPKAKNEVEDLKKLPKEEAYARYLEIKKTNPALARSIKQELLDEKLGTTKEEKRVRNMNVADGERARYVYNRLKDLETKEEKAAYWEDMVKKKILTDDVKKQVKELLKKD